MGHGGRPSELERPASVKILSLLPEDGREMPLAELRKAATTKLHMSPTTLTKNLREMVQTILVNRRVDSLDSRTYYSRNPLPLTTIPTTGDAPPIDIHELDPWLNNWLDSSTAVIKSALATTFLQIMINRNQSLEKAIVEENGRCVFNSSVLKYPWSIISDFQWLVRRMGPEQLKEFAPHVEEIAHRSLDASVLASLNAMKKEFPESAELNMSLDEYKKLLEDPQSRAALTDKLKRAYEARKAK